MQGFSLDKYESFALQLLHLCIFLRCKFAYIVNLLIRNEDVIEIIIKNRNAECLGPVNADHNILVRLHSA